MTPTRKNKSYVNYSSFRSSNFELLRILSMYGIVIHHLVAHSGFTWNQFEVTPIKIWLLSVMPLGKIGVGAFILITGYFTYCHSPKLKSLLRIVTSTGFYSISFYVAALFALRGTALNLQNSFQALFPIISNIYWFVTAYFFLNLFMPYLNMLAQRMAVKQYIILLAVMIFLICVTPYFTVVGVTVYGYSDAAVMILFWFTGAFIRKYENYIKVPSWFLLVCLVVLIAGNFLFHYWGFKLGVTSGRIYSFTFSIGMYNHSLYCYVFAIVVFLLFKNMKIKPNFLINYIATGVFGVYLIQENPYLVHVIFKKFIHITEVQDLATMMRMTFTIPAVIMFTCLLIEFARVIMLGTFQNYYINFLAKVIGKIDHHFTKVIAKVFKRREDNIIRKEGGV